MNEDKSGNPSLINEAAVLERTETQAKEPSRYKVLLLNDDYTPMDFVIAVLEKFHNKSTAEATEIMWQVHNQGIGICGLYPYEIAETKVTQTMDFAIKHQHPLQSKLEKV